MDGNYNCLSWQHGQTEWKEYAVIHHQRLMGQAATMADGSILLLGGQMDPNCGGHNPRGCTPWAKNQTVERVTPGKSEVVFSIKHGDNKNGCAVQPVPGGEVVLLGGGGCFWCAGEPHPHVERYDQTGHLGSLPDLLTARWDISEVKFYHCRPKRFEHACGFFSDPTGKPVLLVAGGSSNHVVKVKVAFLFHESNVHQQPTGRQQTCNDRNPAARGNLLDRGNAPSQGYGCH